MKNIKTTLNNLTTSANKEQQERIAYLLRAITNLENDDINTAAAFVNAADYDHDYYIIGADELADMVRGMDELPTMINMIGDLKNLSGFYRLDGYGWAVDIDADDLALYIDDIANDIANDIN